MRGKIKLLALLLLLPTLNSRFSTLFAQSTVFTYQGRVLDNGTNFTGTGLFKFALVTSTNTSRQAAATAIVNGGFVTGYNVTDGGSGYGSAPAVTVSGGGGSGATATASVSGGAVTGIAANNPGSGYTSTPTVTIAVPPNNLSYTTHWSNDGTSVVGSEPSAAASLGVANGLFTVVLGDATLANMTAISASLFSQPNLQLRIWFHDGINGFAVLSPAQSLTPAPYAVMANSASNLLGTLPATQLSGLVFDSQLSANIARLNGNQTFTGTVTFNSQSNSYTGSFTGNGTGLTNVPGAIPSQVVSGTNVQTQPNTAYEATNMAQVTFTPPTNANVGDVVQVSGLGAGGWQVMPGAGQVINGSQGSVWIARETNRKWGSVASSADGSKLVAGVAGGGGRIYTSTDSGTNWTARETDRYWVGVASSADGSKLIALDTFSTAPGGQIYTSTDSGTNWIARESSRNWSSVVSSADGSKLVAGVALGQIYTSTDGGTNWTLRESNRNWSSVASSADGSKLVAGVFDGQIYTSVPTLAGAQGSTIELQYAGNGVWQPLDGLDGVNISSGTLSDARLSANFAFLNGNQTFSGQNMFNSSVGINGQLSVTTITPGSSLTIAGDAELGTSSGDYRRLRVGGGNSDGFLYGAYNKWSDGIHLGYNYYADAAGGDHFIHSGATSRLSVGYGSIVLATGGVGVAPTTERLVVDTSAVTVFGTFNNFSDRNSKQDFSPVSPSQILDKVTQLPLSEWSYRVDAATRHLGPMAQDFYSAFNIGTDDKHIAPIDEGGIALAAIQGLNLKLTEELKRRDVENAGLKQRIETLERIMRNQR